MTFTTLALSLAAVSLASPAAAPSWGPAYGHGGWGGPAAPANIVLSPDGKNVLDTPEVAHAKAAHLAALAQAQSRAGPDHGQDDGSYDPRWDNDAAWQGPAYGPAAAAPAWGHSAPAWNGAPAPVADTPEVAQAKAAHFAAHARAGPAHGAWGPGPAAPAWGPAPAAHIALSPDGQHVLDTPEVAQAKAEHFAAHARVAGHGAPAPVWNGAPSWHSAPAWNQGAPAWNARAAAPAWNAHAAAPVALSHDGHYIQDTPEVAQAKAAHLAAHAQARGHGGPAW